MQKTGKLLLVSFIFFNVATSLYASTQNKIECINSKKNYLYVGVDNEIKITVVDSSLYDTLLISTSNGVLFKDDSNYNCVPKHSGRASIKVYGVTSALDTINVFSKSIIVYTLPPIKLTLGGILVDELSRMKKEFLLQNDVFDIQLTDDIVNCKEWVEIEKVTMGYLRHGGYYQREEFMGSQLPENHKQIIKSLPSGKELSFEVRLKFTGDVQKNLPIFITKVY